MKGTVNTMLKTASNVTVIPALSTEELKRKNHKQIRVAAYCRVSTDHEEQINSYQVQVEYYTNYINSNSEWAMAGIFADEGISGTQTKKRTEFNRMIRKCRQKKIDLILCKSVSRFMRNTVQCLEYIRELRSLGIGIIFEKENINTMKMSGEFIISLYGSFAQAESESISKNVTWGIEKSFREGKVKYVMDKTLGYRMGDDGKPYVIEEEAEIVRRIYRLYLDGLSMQGIANIMQAEGIKRRSGSSKWSRANVDFILKNEKYVGDAILQKTFTVDCITHKAVKNRGEKAKYVIHDCHEAIIDRDTYNRTQQELAKRGSIEKKSNKSKTERGRYSSAYALTDILVCGECGTSYRRVTWTSHGKKQIVWRCISRLEHGSKYCKNSPSINEEKLHNAIVKALNSLYCNDSGFLEMMENNIRTVVTGENDTCSEIMRIRTRLSEIEKARDDMIHLVTSGAVGADSLDKEFESLNSEEESLKEQLSSLENTTADSDEVKNTLIAIREELKKHGNGMTEYDDVTVRKTIECIRVMSKTEINIIFKNGAKITAEVES